jgi:hypothetical protein
MLTIGRKEPQQRKAMKSKKAQLQLKALPPFLSMRINCDIYNCMISTIANTAWPVYERRADKFHDSYFVYLDPTKRVKKNDIVILKLHISYMQMLCKKKYIF